MIKTTGGNALLDINFILEKTHIEERMFVADLGCGASGHFIFPLSNIVGDRGVVYAVDILKTILENIDKTIKQENIKNIKTVWTDLEVFGATKIESGSLDMALLVNTLYQSSKRAEILRETLRMLKKGGQLLAVEWKNVASPLGPPPEKKVKPELLKTAGRKLGLEVKEEFNAGKYHYGIVFTKL